MAKLERNAMRADVATSGDGRGSGGTAAPHYCGICGREVGGPGAALERFGERFCSEAHAEEFTQTVRAARVQAAALAPSTAERQPAEAADGTAPQRDWKAYLGRALCWGAPVLAVVLLLGGGSALAGPASGLLPVLALLACPLGMGLMMWAMSKGGQRDDRGDKGGEK